MKFLVADISSLIGQRFGQQRKVVKANDKSSVALINGYIQSQKKVTWMLNAW
ncbi:hypothetical protein [Vibrio ziniensis]|uniref:Uncharacterized protein n=1 Tax=Vibrio ziniensis TaxID=2711221 RepID=A0A6G7CJ10_9VIBR|nr:hypothetical protein [Vibrio ziniensis]QIH42092.1 hypothetical protein G5S32_08830 [Vibrio ziniensis]